MENLRAYFHSLMTHFTGETENCFLHYLPMVTYKDGQCFHRRTQHCSGFRWSGSPVLLPVHCYTCTQENNMWPLRTVSVCLAPRHQPCLSYLRRSYAFPSLHHCTYRPHMHVRPSEYLSSTTWMKAVYDKALTVFSFQKHLALVLAGIDIIFFLVAGTLLCSGFSMRIIIKHWPPK